MKRSWVGKIIRLDVAAWARRARDFAHADGESSAPLPTLQFYAEELIE
jgi:hypothetical protein